MPIFIIHIQSNPMFRRCIICKKRRPAYIFLRLQVNQSKDIHVCFLRSYRASILKTPKQNRKNTPQQECKSVWICINEVCIGSLLKKPQRLQPHFHSIPSLTNFMCQIQNVFSHELGRYITYLYRQGNTTMITQTLKPEDLSVVMKKKYNFILLHRENISLHENEIQRPLKNTNIYQYTFFSYPILQRFPYDIALWDHSTKQKCKSRTQRIETILEIWARLRYID